MEYDYNGMMGELFNQTIEEIVKKLDIKTSDVSKIRHLMALDPVYKQLIEDRENFWLNEANTILCELVEAIRTKIMDPDTTMGDLVRALDVISDKYNLHMGKPTSIAETRHSKLTPEALDAEIIELQGQFLSPLPLEEQKLIMPPQEASFKDGNGDGKTE